MKRVKNKRESMKKSRRDDVINAANCIIRKTGYSNLSFSQIAKTLDVTRENVHHYFKKKELLGNACLDVMAVELSSKFEEIITSTLSSKEKIESYFKIYKQQQNEREDCPIVSLLAEYDLLPSSMQEQVKKLTFIEQENMEIILKQGQEDHSFNHIKDINQEAFLIVAQLKGAVSYSKIYDNFEKTTQCLVLSLIKNDEEE